MLEEERDPASIMREKMARGLAALKKDSSDPKSWEEILQTISWFEGFLSAEPKEEFRVPAEALLQGLQCLFTLWQQ